MAEKTRKRSSATTNKTRPTGKNARPQNSNRARAAQAARRNRRKQILKRRLMFFCAIVVILILLGYLITGLIKGIGGAKAKVNTLTVTQEGITYEELSTVSDLSKSEVKDFARETISEFNKEAKERLVKLDKVSESDGVIYLKTSYTSMEAYSDFTKYEAFAGTVAEAKSHGYDFNTSFVAVENGAKGDSAAVEDVTADESLKVVILRENTTIAVDGDIVFVTDENSEVTDSHTVTVSGSTDNTDASVLTYVIYK